MHIQIELPRTRLRHWHRTLIRALEADASATVSVRLCDGVAATPHPLALLLSLEHLVQAASAPPHVAPLAVHELAPYTHTSTQQHNVDFAFQIGCAEPVASNTPAVRVLFDGAYEEDAMWHALLHRRAPYIGLMHRPANASDWQSLDAVALPALEAPHLISTSAASVAARVIDVLVDVARSQAKPNPTQGNLVTHLCAPITPTGEMQGAPSYSKFLAASQSIAFLSRRVADKARTTLLRFLKAAPRWQVAWQHATSFNPQANATLGKTDVHPLPSTPTSYFADPFPLGDGETTYIFMEEVPFATNRGHISVVAIDREKKISNPRPVLETGHHLSYPHVFRHDGQIWMVPEASAAGGVDLYRGDPFPYHWTHECRLIDRPLHDATLHHDGTRWWMFANVQNGASATWCGLKLFTADALRGPWRACCDDAFVKIDAASARPAGPLIAHDGALFRPSQNCFNGYGDHLTWCRIDCLDEGFFSETPVGRVAFSGTSGWRGPHTWATTPNVTVLDLFAPPRTGV